MHNKIILAILFIPLIMMLLNGCGGSNKEDVSFEPDPFPEPENTPQPTVEEVKPPPEPKPDLPKKQPLNLATVYFEFDRSALTEEATAILADNARQLLDYPNARIRIEGHCDERGTVEYNLALGERRALSVKNYLMNYGISPNRMTIISYGKERPVDPRSNEIAWSKNRRAEFVILGQ